MSNKKDETRTVLVRAERALQSTREPEYGHSGQHHERIPFVFYVLALLLLPLAPLFLLVWWLSGRRFRLPRWVPESIAISGHFFRNIANALRRFFRWLLTPIRAFARFLHSNPHLITLVPGLLLFGYGLAKYNLAIGWLGANIMFVSYRISLQRRESRTGFARRIWLPIFVTSLALWVILYIFPLISGGGAQ